MEHTHLHQTFKKIVGPDQAQGIKYLSETVDFETTLRERGPPICIITPDLSSLSRDSVERLSDVDKIALSSVLDILTSHASAHSNCTGLTWEQLLSSFATSISLMPNGEKLAVSKDVRGKASIQWFKRIGNPGIGPKFGAVYRLLSEVAAGHRRELETDAVDLTHLRDLMPLKATNLQHIQSRIDLQPPQKHESKPNRDHSSLGSSLAKHASIFERIRRRHPPHHISSVILNTASTQKHLLEGKASAKDRPILEIITLRLPTFDDPKITASRLTVNAWTSVDRRLIFPRAQTVIRIETLERRFGARKEVLEPMKDTETGKQAIARANSLFDSTD